MVHRAPIVMGTNPGSLKPYLAIARFDHWIKNVFVLPGVVIALTASVPKWSQFGLRFLLGALAVGLISSSNYVINEIVDAPFDKHHPTKRFRPIPSGNVSLSLAYLEWLALMAGGLALAWGVSPQFTAVMLVLWVMGVLYNIPPVRTKDIPYLDVVTEAINNPLRLLAGWYIVGEKLPPPASLMMSYWMIGCYFMAIKRYAEYREIADGRVSARYRRSFAHYNEERLLVSIVFYASFAMMTFGAFVVRYRLELVLAFPFVAVVMAVYLRLSFQPNSAAQRPELLYREPALLWAVCACSAALVLLLFVDVPWLYEFFTPMRSGMPVSLR
jgi:4-hydroxybenzoate polyprenyltransferase